MSRVWGRIFKSAVYILCGIILLCILLIGVDTFQYHQAHRKAEQFCAQYLFGAPVDVTQVMHSAVQAGADPRQAHFMSDQKSAVYENQQSLDALKGPQTGKVIMVWKTLLSSRCVCSIEVTENQVARAHTRYLD